MHSLPTRAVRALGEALLVLLLLFTAAGAAEPQFPALTGRVVDQAGILSASARSGLTEMLAQHERSTGQQVVVVTLKSLQGLGIADYGVQLGRHWGIGQKGKNTGALLIVAPAERAVRIEVGYGLEGTLTDARSRIIIEQDILPAFRRGDFNGGVLAGTAAILRTLGGTGAAPAAPRTGWSGVPANEASGASLLVEILLIVVVWGFIITMFRRTAPRRGIGGMGGMGALPWIMMMGPGFRSRGFGAMPPGGGFGGGGFGGFSGGGGSFGGGGASGKW